MGSRCVWEAHYDESCEMHKFFMMVADRVDLEEYCRIHNLKLYEDKCNGRQFVYHTMHRWSVDNVETFWELFFEFTGVIASVKYTKVLACWKEMSEIPKWFIGCRLNYAENVLRFCDDRIAITSIGEGVTESHTTFAELNSRVRHLANAFRAFGLKKGDVVGSILPNVTLAVECMLAVASIGAIWTSASADTQTMGIVMRMKQTSPKLLLSYDVVEHSGKRFSQVEKLEMLCREMPSVQCVIVSSDISRQQQLMDISSIDKAMSFQQFELKYANKDDKFWFEQVPFDHPLFVMYSSGTTGIPKGLVHSVGGTLVQHLKDHILHENINRSDTFFYYTITAWVIWNWTVTSLATGCRIVLYSGSPFYPNEGVIFNWIDNLKVTVFGAGAALYQIWENKNYHAKEKNDLSILRTVLSTGSVLPDHTYEYILDHIKSPLQIGSMAAATDIISCFGGVNPILNVYCGEVQNVNLAMSVETWSSDGKRVFDEPGELVVTKPFPSMPVMLWGDVDNTKYRSTYFSKFPLVWVQGDYCKTVSVTGGIIMLGRSDATLNPFGVRIGSTEIYAVVESIPEVEDSLCVGQMHNENERIVLFLKMKDGDKRLFTPQFVDKVRETIRSNLSYRHVPQLILPINDVPYTLTGKKIEMAVKKIIARQPFVIQRESLRNPEALDKFIELVDSEAFA